MNTLRNMMLYTQDQNYHIKMEIKNPVTFAHSANQQIRKYMEQAAFAIIVLKCFPQKKPSG